MNTKKLIFELIHKAIDQTFLSLPRGLGQTIAFTSLLFIGFLVLPMNVSGQMTVDGCGQIASINFAAAHPSQVEQPVDPSGGPTDTDVRWGNEANSGNLLNGGGKW
ncbi:MAG: hypothetical protein OEM26_13690, partial [Saprospiraceae bacterium]|nr:hypothetical protein [Saprospiraceae bacterium]